MQGEAAPRQADIAKRTEIEQSLIVNALYLDNFNAQWVNTQNTKLAIMPYAYSSNNIPVEGYDEEIKEPVVGEVNVPQYDMEGNVVDVLNDVTSSKYYWRIDAVDNSPSAKAGMMQDAANILNSISSPLVQADQSGEFFAEFLAMLDNPVLSKAGKKLLDVSKKRQETEGAAEQQKVQQEMQADMMKAQAEVEKARKAGVTLSFSGADIAQYPFLLRVINSLGLQPPTNTQTPPPEAVPAAQPQGDVYANA